MAVEFGFHYSPHSASPQSVLEIAEVSSSHFLSLFNCNPALLERWQLWHGFVQEYRENSRRFQEWMETQSDADWEQFLGMESPSSELSEMYWGPSSPFAPSEARDWAQNWIKVLATLGEDEMRAAFPLDVDPHGALRFDAEAATRDLQSLIAQAECAAQHALQMTVDMTIS